MSLVLAALPTTLRAAAIVVQHRSAQLPNLLVDLLQRQTRLRVVPATDGAALEPGVVYVVPSDFHAAITPTRTLKLFDGRRIQHVRSSANPLFESAADVFGPRVVGVVLTGRGHDATDGVQAVRRNGGIVLVEDPLSAQAPSMPLSALRTGAVHLALPLAAIAPQITHIVDGW